MIRDALDRLTGRATGAADSADVRALRAEVERLEAQNAKLRWAMRHCIDCEYRIEVIERRSSDGLPAAGSS